MKYIITYVYTLNGHYPCEPGLAVFSCTFLSLLVLKVKEHFGISGTGLYGQDALPVTQLTVSK